VPVVSALWLVFTPPRVVTVTAAPVDTDCVEKPMNLSAVVENRAGRKPIRYVEPAE
jgi:hypothetical protein